MSSTDDPADIVISTFAERPAYVDRVYEMADGWPTFLLHDRVANALLGQVVSTFPELCVIATLDDEPVARGLALPFAQHTERRRGVLTPGGWDEVMLQGFADHRRGTPPDTVSALEIAITPGQRGRGLSARMVGALRDAAAAQGFRELVAPIRPTEKHREPQVPLAEYAARTREDGLPADAWQRTHVRLGAVVDRVAPTSMVISGSLAEWREWTGLPFDRSGEVLVPAALNPVVCSVEHDHAVYVEPNLWLRHAL